jgi:hypothetical protein
MVDDAQKQKFRGRDVRTESSLPIKYQYRDPETNRTRIYDYDPTPPKGSIPRDFLRQRQPGIEQFNMRPPRQGVMGVDIASNDFQPNQSGIMLAMNNNPTMNKIQNIYNKVHPFVPDIDIDNREIGYNYEKDLGPGTFNVGGNYDFDDNEYDFNLGYKMTFDEGGMATLPTPHDYEGIATLPTPEGMQRERVPLTDEQKDFLYDYMLDFMFKQKQREQMEQESIIPPFNYEGLEV